MLYTTSDRDGLIGTSLANVLFIVSFTELLPPKCAGGTSGVLRRDDSKFRKDKIGLLKRLSGILETGLLAGFASRLGALRGKGTGPPTGDPA